MALEILDFAFVFLGGLPAVEGTKIASPSGLFIDLARIEAILS